jgi:hypothetical protein
LLAPSIQITPKWPWKLKPKEFAVLQDLEGLLRNELRIFGATTCDMTRRIDALD